MQNNDRDWAVVNLTHFELIVFSTDSELEWCTEEWRQPLIKGWQIRNTIILWERGREYNIQWKICISTAQQRICLSVNDQIICLHVHLGALLVQGEGVRERDPLTNRVRWVDYDEAFERRIQTEVFVNIVHKEIIEFFDDALIWFRKHIRDALIKLGVMKVYTELGAKFKTTVNDTEIIELKT